MQGNTFAKAGVVGLVGSLVMFILMQIALSTGMAPFNVPPSAAFLISLGLPAKPLALFVHFLYGAFWSILLVALYKQAVSVGKGVLFSLVPWLIMMLILSPLIGWGIFGSAEAEVAKDHQLYLAPGPKYVVATLVLHIVFGLVIGGLNRGWALKGERPAQAG